MYRISQVIQNIIILYSVLFYNCIAQYVAGALPRRMVVYQTLNLRPKRLDKSDAGWYAESFRARVYDLVNLFVK